MYFIIEIELNTFVEIVLDPLGYNSGFDLKLLNMGKDRSQYSTGKHIPFESRIIYSLLFINAIGSLSYIVISTIDGNLLEILQSIMWSS